MRGTKWGGSGPSTWPAATSTSICAATIWGCCLTEGRLLWARAMLIVLSAPIWKPLAIYLVNVWSGWAANACCQAGREAILWALAGSCTFQSEQVWGVLVSAIHHIPYTVPAQGGNAVVHNICYTRSDSPQAWG